MDNTLINVIVGGGIAIISGLLGASVSGLSTYINANLQAKRDERKLVLSKLEELYALINELMKVSFWFASKTIEYSKEDFQIEKLNEITSLITEPMNRIFTLTAFYTSLDDEIRKLSEPIIELQNYGLQFVQHTVNDEQELLIRAKIIISICDGILEKIQKESRQYTGLIKK